MKGSVVQKSSKLMHSCVLDVSSQWGSVLSKAGCPFGKASLILSLPLPSDSSFLAVQVELVC